MQRPAVCQKIPLNSIKGNTTAAPPASDIATGACCYNTSGFLGAVLDAHESLNATKNTCGSLLAAENVKVEDSAYWCEGGSQCGKKDKGGFSEPPPCATGKLHTMSLREPRPVAPPKPPVNR